MASSFDRFAVFSLNGIAGQWVLLDSAMILISAWQLWTTLAAVLFVYGIRSKRYQFCTAVILSLVAIGITDVIAAYFLKPFFHQLRPCHAFPELINPIDGCAGKFGLPSNHASNAMAAVVVLSKVIGNIYLSALFVFSYVLVSISRIFLGAHYPVDTLVGGLWGGTVGLLCCRYVLRIPRLQKYTQPRE